MCTRFLVLLLILLSGTIHAKPRRVEFDQEMRTAKFVGLVVIDSYDGAGHINFHSVQYHDTIKSATCGYSGTDGFKFGNPESDEMTGCYPFKHDTVVVVIDSNGSISLFAKRVGYNYRFWSPFFTGSIAYFVFSAPAMPLANEHQDTNDTMAPIHWDGCLLAVDRLNAYKK